MRCPSAGTCSQRRPLEAAARQVQNLRYHAVPEQRYVVDRGAECRSLRCTFVRKDSVRGALGSPFLNSYGAPS